MDRLPSFAVNLDEDPTDIFGAVCALLVCSALLKNCNNYLLDNKTFLWPCLHWKEYCDFWVNSSANSTKIKLARWDFMLYYIICWSPCFQLLQRILQSIFRTGAMSSNFPLLTTKDRRTTLPSLPGQRDTEERGYINASHHGGSSCSVTGSDGIFFHCHPRVVRIFSWDCRITLQSNSPIPVLPTMQSDDVRQENMATVNIPLKYCWKSFKRKQFIHSTIAELQVSMAVYSCIQTRLMTTSDRSQCPELISNYEFNDHCPRVKFVYYVNKYLLVPSFKLETSEIIRNSVTKDAFFYVPIHKFLNIYFSLMYTGKPITSKH